MHCLSQHCSTLHKKPYYLISLENTLCQKCRVYSNEAETVIEKSKKLCRLVISLLYTLCLFRNKNNLFGKQANICQNIDVNLGRFYCMIYCKFSFCLKTKKYESYIRRLNKWISLLIGCVGTAVQECVFFFTLCFSWGI